MEESRGEKHDGRERQRGERRGERERMAERCSRTKETCTAEFSRDYARGRLRIAAPYATRRKGRRRLSEGGEGGGESSFSPYVTSGSSTSDRWATKGGEGYGRPRGKNPVKGEGHRHPPLAPSCALRFSRVLPLFSRGTRRKRGPYAREGDDRAKQLLVASARTTGEETSSGSERVLPRLATP